MRAPPTPLYTARAGLPFLREMDEHAGVQQAAGAQRARSKLANKFAPGRCARREARRRGLGLGELPCRWACGCSRVVSFQVRARRTWRRNALQARLQPPATRVNPQNIINPLFVMFGTPYAGSPPERRRLSHNQRRPATPTVAFIDQYSGPYRSLFKNVRHFEQFTALHVGLLAETRHKSLPRLGGRPHGSPGAASLSCPSRLVGGAGACPATDAAAASVGRPAVHSLH